MVLVDTAFGSVEFLEAMRKRRLAVLAGVRYDRKLSDGRQLGALVKKGQQVRLKGLSFPVTISWYYLKRDGQLKKRFVLSTRPLKGSTLTWWGRRRWQIEGFFKTIKHRLGLHRFGQQRLLGVYRWFLIGLLGFLLAHWVYLSTGSVTLPDWGQSAAEALKLLLPEVSLALLLIHIEQSRSLLHSWGFELQLVTLKT